MALPQPLDSLMLKSGLTTTAEAKGKMRRWGGKLYSQHVKGGHPALPPLALPHCWQLRASGCLPHSSRTSRFLSVLLPPEQDAHGNSVNICSLTGRRDSSPLPGPLWPAAKVPDPTPNPSTPHQACNSDLLLLRSH